MSEHGAALQTYNLELVKCLEDLKAKRYDVLQIINREELEKATLEKNLRLLQEKLSTINNSLHKHKTLFENYEKTIADTENGFKKILESSQTLLNLVQLEANKMETCSDKKVLSKSYSNNNNY